MIAMLVGICLTLACLAGAVWIIVKRIKTARRPKNHHGPKSEQSKMAATEACGARDSESGGPNRSFVVVMRGASAARLLEGECIQLRSYFKT